MFAPAMDRIQSERQFHDEQAARRANTFRRDPHRLQFSDEQYLDHESWLRPAWAELGPLNGKSVLDYGCGHGMAAVALARHGARVTAFDLSADYIAEAQERARANDVAIAFLQADGHALPFPDASFDAVWGNAILHHLDLSVAGRELHRVLKPGGVAVFCEPWGENPLLSWARRRLPYPGKERTRDEEPLRRRDLEGLRKSFPRLQVRGFQIMSMIHRAVHIAPLTASLELFDKLLLGILPSLENWCRYVVLTLRRD
jgi:SAM-dependent methyltransferase